MRSSAELIQSEAFTSDLTPYMGAARDMYPGGRFRKIVRAVDMIFHRGLVEFTDSYHAMILADRAQRTALAAEQEMLAPQAHIEPNPFQPELIDVLPDGGVIGE